MFDIYAIYIYIPILLPLPTKNVDLTHLATRSLKDTNLIGVHFEFDIGSSNDGRTQVTGFPNAVHLIEGQRKVKKRWRFDVTKLE